MPPATAERDGSRRFQLPKLQSRVFLTSICSSTVAIMAWLMKRTSQPHPNFKPTPLLFATTAETLFLSYPPQHVTYGVKEEMYPSVVSALLITLEKGLGKECRPETKEAWEWVMNSISAVCIAAAREEVAGVGTTTATAGVKPRSALLAFATESRVVAAVVVAVAAAAVGFAALNKRG